MKKAKTYREYKADCIRIAQLMSAKDKEALPKMAEAWEDRAREAERQEKKAEGGKVNPMRVGTGSDEELSGGYDALWPRGMMPEGRTGLRRRAPLRQRSNARGQILRC